MEALDWHAAAHADRLHIHLYTDGQQEEQISYGALRREAGAVAAALAQRKLERGQRVAIMLPTSRGYFLAFFGTLLAGGVPVPLYPPVRPSQLEEHLRRHVGILTNAQAVFLITMPEAKPLAEWLRARADSLRDVLTVDEMTATGAPTPEPAPLKAQDIALLQYT
ncbi:MAG: AMP-binding protein, partial [Verrucomicrobiae bacterium]|nr:AMP-binding protein [Verrucomicrobiae bacterium]